MARFSKLKIFKLCLLKLSMVGKRGKSIVVEGDSPVKDHLKDSARTRFIAQGTTSEASTSLSSAFIVPFARAIGANVADIGFLSAFSGIIAPLGNLWGSKLMEKHSRKWVHVVFTGWIAFVWIPIILLAFLYARSIGVPYLPYALIALYSLFIFFSAVKDPPSFSWIGDLVPEEQRGHYFARRNKVIGWTGVVIFLIGGIVLYFFEKKPYVLAIYSLVFIASILFRIVSLYQVKHIYCPHFKLHKGYSFSFWSFLKRYDNFGKFSVFQAAFNFAVMVASPFFAVYMLQELHFNLFWFTAVSLSSTVFYLLLTPLAGKFSDRYGNLKLLYIAAWAFPITPLLWLFLKDPVLLFLLPGFTAGLGNAALGIGSTNFMYYSIKPERRGICFTYSNILTGIGVFFGSIFGGLMIQYLHVTFMNTILFVFVVAAILRFVVAFAFVPQLKEERRHHKLRGLSWDVYHPFKTIHSDVVWFKKFVRQ